MEMKVTFDRSTSGKIFTRQLMAVLQLLAKVTSFRRKKKIYWDHSGKIIPSSLCQSQRYVSEVSRCVFERSIMSQEEHFHFGVFSEKLKLTKSSVQSLITFNCDIKFPKGFLSL